MTSTDIKARGEQFSLWSDALLNSVGSALGLAIMIVETKSGDLLYGSSSFFDIWKIQSYEFNKSFSNGRELLNLAARRVEKIPSTEPSQLFDPKENETSADRELLLKDGRSIRSIALPIRDRESHLLGQLYLFQDITEKVHVLKERQLLEEQLFQVQKQQALGTLAGGVAHDFNNILAAILGFTELVGDDVPNGTVAASNIEEIIKGIRRARAVVQQLLTFSRFHQVEPSLIDPVPIIEETLGLLRASWPPNIAIETSFPKKRTKILANPNQLQQILMNLCINAQEAIGENPGKIEIGLEELLVDDDLASSVHGLREGWHFCLSVRDSGHGIAPEHLKQIFEPFFTTKPTGKGSGLGLSVVYGIATNHGWALDVQSKFHEGAQFNLYIPEPESFK